MHGKARRLRPFPFRRRGRRRSERGQQCRRKSGKAYRTPIYVVELDGQLYLCSPRGETTWSSNLRSTGEAWLKIKGNETRFRATELPPEQRGPIIAAYLARWGNQTKADFLRLPDPIDHPTFRLEPAGVGGQEAQHIAGP